MMTAVYITLSIWLVPATVLYLGLRQTRDGSFFNLSDAKSALAWPKYASLMLAFMLFGWNAGDI